VCCYRENAAGSWTCTYESNTKRSYEAFTVDSPASTLCGVTLDFAPLMFSLLDEWCHVDAPIADLSGITTPHAPSRQAWESVAP
jgi:hypothetical protein